MIFVVLGTQKFPLNRLLKQLDEYVEAGLLDGEELMAQIGHTDYEPKHFAYERFMDKEQFDRSIAAADLLIAHSGVGTIITGLKSHRPVLVYPRMAKYHEHVDDHQLDIARAFEKKNYVMCCYDTDVLSEKIQACKNHEFAVYQSNRERIVGVIEKYIEEEC